MFSSQWLLDDHSGFWIQAFTFGIKIKLHLSTKSNLAFIIKYWTCPFVMHPVGMYTNRMKTQMYIKDLGSQIHQLILFLSRGNSLSLYARPHGVKVPHDQILKHSHAFPNYWEQKKKKKNIFNHSFLYSQPEENGHLWFARIQNLKKRLFGKLWVYAYVSIKKSSKLIFKWPMQLWNSEYCSLNNQKWSIALE